MIQYASTLNGDGFKLSNFTNTTIDEFMVLYGALQQTPIYTAFTEETIGSGLKKIGPLKRHGLTSKSL